MRKLDRIKAEQGKGEIRTTIHVDQSDQVKAIGDVQGAIERLYNLLNDKQQAIDMSVLEKQLVTLNEKLDFSADFTLLRDAIRQSKVEAVTIKDFNQLLQAIESNKPLPINIDLSSLEKAIIQVEQRIQESTVTNNAPEDYSPMRRVIKVGTRLIYDDNPTGTGGRGGGSGQTSLILEDAPVSSNNPLPVEATLNVGDISIGAVEIKNSTDDTRATVGANGLHVDVRSTALPSTPVAFVTTVTTAGTRVQLASNSLSNGGVIQAPSTNTGNVFVGGSNVSSSVYGAELQPGQATSIAVSNSNAVYIDAATNGDKAAFLGS